MGHVFLTDQICFLTISVDDHELSCKQPSYLEDFSINFQMWAHVFSIFYDVVLLYSSN